MARLATLTIAMLITGQAHAGVIGVARNIDMNAVSRCVTQTTGLPVRILPVVEHSDEWKIRVTNICCDRFGNSADGFATSILSINYVTLAGTVTLSRSADFEHAVHEVAAFAYVQNGGNRWDRQARERVGYQAEFDASDCE